MIGHAVLEEKAFPEFPIELYRANLKEIIVVQIWLYGIVNKVIVHIVGEGKIKFIADVAAQHSAKVEAISIREIGICIDKTREPVVTDSGIEVKVALDGFERETNGKQCPAVPRAFKVFGYGDL